MNVLYCLLMKLVAVEMHQREEPVSMVTRVVGLGCLVTLCRPLFVFLKAKNQKYF